MSSKWWNGLRLLNIDSHLTTTVLPGAAAFCRKWNGPKCWQLVRMERLAGGYRLPKVWANQRPIPSGSAT